MDLERIQPIGNRNEKKSSRSDQPNHLADAEAPGCGVHHVLQHRRALAKIEESIVERQWLVRRYVPELATIRDAIEPSPFAGNLHLLGVHVGPMARHVGVK